MHGPRAAAADDAQGFGIFRQQRGAENSYKLMLRPRGIQQRAEEIEDRRRALGGEFLAHGADDLERRMPRRREDECDAVLFEALTQAHGREFELHAEFLEHVRRAGLRGHRAVAVLHHARAARGGDKHDRGRDIEKSALIAARAAHVERRPRQPCGVEFRRERVREQGLGKRCDLEGGLAFLSQRAEEILLRRSGNIFRDKRRDSLADLRGSKVVSCAQRLGESFHDWMLCAGDHLCP